MIRPESSPFEFDPDALILRVRRTLRGQVEAIQPLVDELMAAVAELECAAGAEAGIEVSLLEAISNAVRHGCEHDPERQVEVCVACEADRGVLIVVRDPGTGFDPAQIPSPIEGERLLARGGRGIFLINRLMDDVHYTRGGTELWMRKRPTSDREG